VAVAPRLAISIFRGTAYYAALWYTSRKLQTYGDLRALDLHQTQEIRLYFFIVARDYRLRYSDIISHFGYWVLAWREGWLKGKFDRDGYWRKVESTYGFNDLNNCIDYLIISARLASIEFIAKEAVELLREVDRILMAYQPHVRNKLKKNLSNYVSMPDSEYNTLVEKIFTQNSCIVSKRKEIETVRDQLEPAFKKLMDREEVDTIDRIDMKKDTITYFNEFRPRTIRSRGVKYLLQLSRSRTFDEQNY
jgi:hypothetical protein